MITPMIIPFDKLTKRQQRISIAYDVIEQLHKGSYYPVEGTYIRHMEGGCECCAYGSCLLSLAKKTEERRRAYDSDDMRWKLRQVFSPNQLFYIETSFDNRVSVVGGHSFGDLSIMSKILNLANLSWLICQQFKKYYSEPKERLIAIMGNIIEHGGHFIPLFPVVSDKFFRPEQTDEDIRMEKYTETLATLPIPKNIMMPKSLLVEDDGGIIINKEELCLA